MESVVIVATGTSNTASVAVAVRRCGMNPVESEDPRRVAGAQRVILPGVGSFESGMDGLHRRGLVDALRARVLAQRPLLAICLGFQLLCRSSEESPGVEGIGALDAVVRRLPSSVRVPQFGWNFVDVASSRFLEPGFAYYANSYAAMSAPPQWRCATTMHGERFVAAIERGPVLACQFHPELSGAWGSSVLRRWLTDEERSFPC